MFFYFEFEANLFFFFLYFVILTMVAILFYLRNPTIFPMIFWLEFDKKSDNNCISFLSKKSKNCFNVFYFELEGSLFIVAILFYLRNPTILSIICGLEFKRNLTIIATLLYMRNATVLLVILQLNI